MFCQLHLFSFYLFVPVAVSSFRCLSVLSMSLCCLSVVSLQEKLWLRDEAGKFEMYGHGANTSEVLEQFPFVPSWHVRVSGGEGERRSGSGGKDVRVKQERNRGEHKTSLGSGSGAGDVEEPMFHKPWWQYRYVDRLRL